MNEWLLGTGYVRLFARLHRAQESRVMSAPIEHVIATAESDELRLRGSTIQNADRLVEHLRAAVSVLKASAGIGQPGVPVAAGLPPMPPPAPSAAEERLARETIRHVRRAINEYRDDCRLGLVRARNQLLRTVTATALLVYLLLALAIAVGVPREGIVAGATFFLVGAVIGLFNRLYLDASAQTVVEDYGLSSARLLHTPLLSGIAALGGVLVVPMLAALINPSADAAVAASAASVPRLEDIFNVAERPFGVVVAAIFGLSPATLINRLQEESEQYKTGLTSSEVPGQE